MGPTDILRALDAFELRMRGVEWWPYRVPLEPLFTPMLSVQRGTSGHIDDARKPGLIERLTRVPPKTSAPREPTPVVPSRRSDDPRDIIELRLLSPPELALKGETASRFLSSLRSIPGCMSFEIIGTPRDVSIQLACEADSQSRVRAALDAYLPALRVREVPCALAESCESAGAYLSSIHLGLTERVFRSLAADQRLDVDPLIEAVSQLDHLDEHELGLVQILFEAARPSWGEELLGFVKAIDDLDRVQPLIERKFRQPCFAVVLRVAAWADTPKRSAAIAENLATALHTMTRSEENELTVVAPGGQDAEEEFADILDREARRSGMILSLAELATLVHAPSASVRSRRLLRQSGNTRAAPPITQGHPLVLGSNEHDGDIAVVSLSIDDRLRHTYAIGASGTGKSTLLLSMAAQDIALDNGFAVLDPHGDLVEDILARIPEERAKDVILFDPADEAFPIGFNILQAHSELERTLLASDLVSIFKRLSTSFGDVMVSILGNAALAFLESSEGGTLIDLRNFLIDPTYRKKRLKTVRDEEVVSYWTNEFTLLKGVPHAPVLTRLNAFLRPKLIRRMVAQKEDRLDFRWIMDERNIFLAKLSHGAIGEENAHLLGSLLVSKIAQAAMSRQNVETSARAPYVCYIDEFHHFVTPSIATILSGARKYGLGLVLAHQELRQLKSRNEDVASAVLSNAGTRIVFRVGEQDAKTLAEGFSSFQAKDLMSLDVGQAIARVQRADWDFNLRTYPLEPVDAEIAVARREAVEAASRTSYATPAGDVDRALASTREHASSTDLDAPPAKPIPTTRKPNPAIAEPAQALERPGRGGTQHKYLQSLIRRVAEARGFTASVEREVLDGHGYVDLVLDGYGVSVACEISVSTSIEHEIGNLTKCLAAGFDHVLLVSSNDTLLDLARLEMAGQNADAVRILKPGDVATCLSEIAGAPAPPDRAPKRQRALQPPAPPAGGKALLTTNAAAAYVGLAVQTLAEMRVSGESPPFHKAGRRVLYDREDLDAWLAARKRRSTSDRGSA